LKAAALALTAYVNVSDYLKEYVMEQFHCLALEVVRKGPGRQEAFCPIQRWGGSEVLKPWAERINGKKGLSF
jgi:hypothetical protein